MKTAMIGALIGAGLVMAATAVSSPRADVFAQPALGARSAAGSELIALSSDAAQGRQQISLIDPERRTICVYHVDPTSGEIALKSVRNFHWDLHMTEFNGVSPLPQEIRSLVENR